MCTGVGPSGHKHSLAVTPSYEQTKVVKKTKGTKKASSGDIDETTAKNRAAQKRHREKAKVRWYPLIGSQPESASCRF